LGLCRERRAELPTHPPASCSGETNVLRTSWGGAGCVGSLRRGRTYSPRNGRWRLPPTGGQGLSELDTARGRGLARVVKAVDPPARPAAFKPAARGNKRESCRVLVIPWAQLIKIGGKTPQRKPLCMRNHPRGNRIAGRHPHGGHRRTRHLGRHTWRSTSGPPERRPNPHGKRVEPERHRPDRPTPRPPRPRRCRTRRPSPHDPRRGQPRRTPHRPGVWGLRPSWPV
jgi:hypothetical protein